MGLSAGTFLRSIKRGIAPAVLRAMTAVLAKYDYEVLRRPAPLRRTPGAEMSVDLAFVLSDLLRSRPALSFVQIGGFDGRSGDPLFEDVTERHWKGVIAEPQPEAFDLLRQAYSDEPQVVLRNVAVAEREGVRALWRVRPGTPGLPSWAPQLASFDRETFLRHRAQIPDIEAVMESVDVPCVTFDTLVREAGLDHIDLVQIDVEGYDYEILKTIDLAHYAAVVRYEHAHIGPDDREECLSLLIAFGYRVAFESHDTVAYKRS